MSILRFSRYREMPWKNGGGVTREIAREPAAGGEPFLFRVSLADVERDGPFSSFPGVDREIMLVEGRGFELHCGREPDRVEVHRIETPLVPFAFSGDASVDCRLLAGPVRDLNVMTLRGHASASLETLAPLRELVLERRPREALIVFVARGQILAERDRGAPEPVLMVGDSLLLRGAEGPRSVLRSVGQEDGRAVLIRIAIS